MTEGEADPKAAVGGEVPHSLKLSMVIPAYNEELRLEDGVSRLANAVEVGAIDPDATEFIVVDDGSTDATVSCAKDLFGIYPHTSFLSLGVNKGKGAAVRAGVAAAAAPMIAFADADMSIDPAQTPDFLRALEGSDVAIGSRAAVGASVDRPSLQRSAMNRAFNGLVNLVTKVALSDTQCGYKAFRSPAAKLLFGCSITERFAFDVEILSLARRLGLTISEVPVQWTRVGGSRIRPWLDPGSMTRDVIRAGRSAKAAPPVPILIITAPQPAALGPDFTIALKGLEDDLSPFVPVLHRSDGEVLVLCPLMDQAQIDATAAQIASAVPESSCNRSMMTSTQLATLAPLSFRRDGN